MHGYNLYGLKVNTTIELEEFKKRKAYKQPHSVVSFGKIKEPKKGLEGTVYTPFHIYSKSFFIQNIPTIARYKIENEKEVTIELDKSKKIKAALFYFYDAILPILLIINDFFPVHASAVDTDNGVHLFNAVRGDGKSALAASLSLKNYPFISDDLCILKWDDKQQVFLTKCYNPSVQLWSNSLSIFNDSKQKKFKSKLVRKGLLKYAVDFNRFACKKYKKVAAINIIKVENDAIETIHEQLKGIHKIFISKNIIHTHHVAKIVAKDQSLFKFSGLVAKHLTLNQVRRSRNTTLIDFSNYIADEILTRTTKK